MRKTLLNTIVLAMMISAGALKAQEQQEEVEQEEQQVEQTVQNDDIIKTEVKIGHQVLTNHGQHLAATATGESNILYNKYGHVQLLPFQVNIYTHYEGLSHVQLQNLKVTAINFMMDKQGIGLGAGMYTKEQFGYRATAVPVQTISPVVLSAFHTVEFEDGKTILKISGYLSAGKAIGFGENTRYAFDVEGEQNGGTVVPAGLNAKIDFNNKVQVQGFVDYQHLQANDTDKSYSPVTRTVTKNSITLNEVKYGMTVNLNMSELLNQKLRGVNLYATVSHQQMAYKYDEKTVQFVRTNGSPEKTVTEAPTLNLSKQNYLNVQVGVAIDLRVKPKKKPTHFDF